MFSDFPETKEYGIGAATGIYDLVELAGNAVGPMIFASMFAGDLLIGMMIFTGTLFGASVIYFLISLSVRNA